MDPVVGTLQQAKLVLLGDMGAGKSSLVLRFVKGQFFDYQVSGIYGSMGLVKGCPRKGARRPPALANTATTVSALILIPLVHHRSPPLEQPSSPKPSQTLT